ASGSQFIKHKASGSQYAEQKALGSQFVNQEASGSQYAELGGPAWVNEDPTHSVFSLTRDRGLICWAQEINRPMLCVLTKDGRQLDEKFVSSALRFCAHTERDTQILASQPRGRSSLSFSDYMRVRRGHLMAGVKKHEQGDLTSAVRSIASVWRFASGDSHGDMAADLRGQHAVGPADISIAHDIEIPSEEASPSLKSFRKFSSGFRFEHMSRLRRFSIGTTSNLCSSLMKKFPPHMVRFRQRVCHIDWFKFSNKTVREGVVPEVTITCDNGKVYHAHHVIMAVPLGHLKTFSNELFRPALPQSKLAAIDKMGVGTVSKILLYYKSPCWLAPFHLIWPGRTPEDTGFVADSLSSRCLQFLTLADSPHVLELTLLGDIPARAAVDDAHVAQEVSDILGHLSSRQALMWRCKPVPPPDKIVRSDWGSNPLYQGSHPYIRRGCDSENTEHLVSPVTFRGRPVLQFAGDFTWPDLSRLMHGARSSGLREAARLELL
ncbi:hypothetical protein EGW08_019889, partial [Elysia chlorotica]